MFNLIKVSSNIIVLLLISKVSYTKFYSSRSRDNIRPYYYIFTP